MSVALDKRLEKTGTKFLIFPQPRFLGGFMAPEVVMIDVPPTAIQPGPADDRMYVVDAVNKLPYSQIVRPPYRGEANPPVRPGPGGHFDHLHPDSREFSAATMYATVRRVLDIWEDYFGHTIAWHFETDFARLELIPLIEWDNAQSGYGFLEFGYGRNDFGGIDHTNPYCQNFDVLAHELGHSLVFAEVGIPMSPSDEALDYGGFHESAGDLVAIIGALHFNAVVDVLLARTKGNLFSVNELERVGELSNNREIRMAFNNVRMSDVAGVVEPHDRSLPLTGGIFDVLVEVFQKDLVKRGLISQDLSDRSTQGTGRDQDLDAIQGDFSNAYEGKAKEFKEALLSARDYLGRLLAVAWGDLSPDFLTYHDVLRALMRADRTVTNAGHQQTIRECFAWREILLVPDSIFLKQHSINKCGLRMDRPAARESEKNVESKK